MKIEFDDGSFIHMGESVNDSKVVTVTMCGVNSNGNSVTMSSSELDADQAQEIYDFLDKILKSFA